MTERTTSCLSVTEGAISVSRRRLAYYRTQIVGHSAEELCGTPAKELDVICLKK